MKQDACGNDGLMEKHNPLFPQPLEIAMRFLHSQQADDEADGKVENQNQVSHFPTHDSLPL